MTKKEGGIWEIQKCICKKTGFKTRYITTYPYKALKNSFTQLKLF